MILQYNFKNYDIKINVTVKRFDYYVILKNVIYLNNIHLINIFFTFQISILYIN